MRGAAALSFALLLPTVAAAATLHGRIKDQQCSVLSQVTVRLRPAHPQGGAERTATTDEAGNYTVDLPAGEYQLCVRRSAQAQPACTALAVAGTGDTWITTQLRDMVPDLSNLGNRAY